MCVRLCGGRSSTPMQVAQPIQPRLSNDRAAEAAPLPDDKDLLDPDEVADVTFGGKNKKPETLATRKTGTQALKIPLNVSGQGSSINV